MIQLSAFNLKSKGHGLTDPRQRFAMVIEPKSVNFFRPENDQELYALVQAHGKAVIHRFIGASFELEPETVTLTAQEFEQEWEGD